MSANEVNGMKKGLFITLEGLDGAGKTTQIALIEEKARQLGLDAIVTKEPGGTPVGDAIRMILLDPCYSEMTVLTEALLYAASRAQLVHDVIKPALQQNKLVICDRFLDSSLAYQAVGGGLDYDFVGQINRQAVDGCLPDLTFVLDLSPEESRARQPARDRMEQKTLAFHRRVREGFLALAEKFPHRVHIIDACRSPEEVFSEIWEYMSRYLAARR
jgi:dTMP kinase